MTMGQVAHANNSCSPDAAAKLAAFDGLLRELVDSSI
jgi:hypothetical protein